MVINNDNLPYKYEHYGNLVLKCYITEQKPVA